MRAIAVFFEVCLANIHGGTGAASQFMNRFVRRTEPQHTAVPVPKTGGRDGHAKR